MYDDRGTAAVKNQIGFRAGMRAVFFAVPILFASLAAGQDSAVKTLETVSKIRERCLAVLEKAFASEDAFIRSAAVRAAGESEDPALLPLLKRGSKDYYSTARLFALQGIQKISSTETFLAAKSLLEDKDAWVKAAAMSALGETGNKQTIPLVKPFLQSPDPMIRLAAAFSLYKLGEEANLSRIIDSLSKGDIVNRYQAISYLGKIGSGKAIARLTGMFDDERDEITAYSLKAIGERANIEMLGSLKKLVRSPNPSVRHNAVLLLGYLPARVSLAIVREFCSDADAFVRLSAAISLNRMGSDACQDIFAQLLENKDFSVRSSVARIIGETPMTNRMKLLAKALGDPNSRVRTAAVRAVGMAGGAESFFLLAQMLDDPQEAIRAYAAGNLIRLLN